jgi:ABC-type glycerol-3-phosphate transport system permease component
MKESIKQIKKGIIFWISAGITILLIWTIHAAWVTINSVNSWDSLTSTLMNNIINNQKDINTRLDNMLWVWQSRQDVKVSRVVWNSYTNDTWKPILVSVVNEASSGTTASYLHIEVDWVLIWKNYNWVDTSNTDATGVSVIVPNGSTYRIVNSWMWHILSWKEFR